MDIPHGVPLAIKKALIVPDLHIPFHDRKALKLMLKVASSIGVDEVVLLGDVVDFYSVSQFGKDPRVSTLLTEEISAARAFLDELDSLFPSAKKVYLSGNHEQRLENYLIDKAPGLFGLTEVRFLFGLNQRPLWTYVPFGRAQGYRVLGSELYAFHRPKASTPKQHISRVFVSSLYGDIHKIESAHAVTLDGRHLLAHCPGWLGDVSSRVFDYMPSVPQWQLGFAVVYLDTSTSLFHVEQFEIKNHSTILHGKIIKA